MDLFLDAQVPRPSQRSSYTTLSIRPGTPISPSLHGVLIGLGGVIWPCWRRAHDVTHSGPRKRPGWWRSSVTEDNRHSEQRVGPAGLGKGGAGWPEVEERHSEADGEDGGRWQQQCEHCWPWCRLK